MKVGDKLYCYSNHNDEYDYTIDLTINSSYTIVSVGRYGYDEITIINDIVAYYCFNTNTEGVTYYGKWFHTEQDLRKIKLEKLNENRKMKVGEEIIKNWIV